MFSNACNLLADDGLVYGDDGVVTSTRDVHSVQMSGFISKIDGINQNRDVRVCFNCNNLGHVVKDCKALF